MCRERERELSREGGKSLLAWNVQIHVIFVLEGLAFSSNIYVCTPSFVVVSLVCHNGSGSF